MKLSISKDSFYDFLFCLLILVLPFSLKAPNIVLISLILFFFIDYKQLKYFEFRKIFKLPYLFLGILILYWFIKGLITGTLNENKYGLLIPILFLPLLALKVRDYYKLLYTIVVCGFIIASRALYGVLNNYIEFKEFLPFEGSSINEIIYMERPYLGFFLIISLLVAIYLWQKLQKLKIIVILYCLYVLITIFLISARMSLITLAILLVVGFLFYLKISIQKRIIFSIFFFISIGLFISFNKNLQERLFITSDYQESIKKFEHHEPRFIIWPCSYSVTESPSFNVFFGLDSEKKLNEFLGECYATKIENKHRADYFVQRKYNTHNQFLGIYLTSGLIGLLLLVSFFIVQWYVGKTNFFKTAITISIFLFFIVENVLYRQIGVYFFGILLVLINIYDFSLKKTDNI